MRLHGRWWQADPNDGFVTIFLAHTMVELHQVARGIGLGVESAIATFHQNWNRIGEWLRQLEALRTAA